MNTCIDIVRLKHARKKLKATSGSGLAVAKTWYTALCIHVHNQPATWSQSVSHRHTNLIGGLDV